MRSASNDKIVVDWGSGVFSHSHRVIRIINIIGGRPFTCNFHLFLELSRCRMDKDLFIVLFQLIRLFRDVCEAHAGPGHLGRAPAGALLARGAAAAVLGPREEVEEEVAHLLDQSQGR